MTADKITLQRIELLHPEVKQEVKEIYNKILDRELNIRFTSTLRTFKEQDVLYMQGRKSLSEVNKARKEIGLYEISEKDNIIVTKAKGGESIHNYGLAIDFCILDTNNTYNMSYDFNKNNEHDWDEVVFLFKSYGWFWGGDWTSFKDYPHFEKTFKYTVNQMYNKYIQNDFIKDTKYINI